MAKRTISKSDEGTTTTPTRRRRINGDAAAADMAPKTPRTRKKAETAPVVSASSVEEIPAAPAPVAASAPVQVSHEQIAVRAYHLYLARGGRGGDQFQDWIVAERELRSGLVGASR